MGRWIQVGLPFGLILLFPGAGLAMEFNKDSAQQGTGVSSYPSSNSTAAPTQSSKPGLDFKAALLKPKEVAPKKPVAASVAKPPTLVLQKKGAPETDRLKSAGADRKRGDEDSDCREMEAELGGSGGLDESERGAGADAKNTVGQSVSSELEKAIQKFDFLLRTGDLEEVKILLGKNPKLLEMRLYKGYTALGLAAGHFHAHIVEYLLNHYRSINVNKLDERGRTAAGWAIISHRTRKVFKDGKMVDSPVAIGEVTAVLGALSQHGANLDQPDGDGRTPLLYAAKTGDIFLVRYLVQDEKVSLDLPDPRGHTALHRAAIGNQVSIMEYLIDDLKFDPEDVDLNGDNALHAAANSGSLDAVKHLIPRNKNLNIRNKKNQTALHQALLSNHPGVALELIAAGADTSIDTNETSLLHIAATMDSLRLFEALKRKGDPDSLDSENNSPLHIALLAGRSEIASELIPATKTKTFGTLNKNGLAPLHLAALMVVPQTDKAPVDRPARRPEKNRLELADRKEAGDQTEKKNPRLEIVKKLIAAGDHVDRTTLGGSSSLHLSARRGDLPVMKFLLEQKANVNLKHNEGLSPLHVAILGGEDKAVDFLLNQKADVNLREGAENSETPLTMASSIGNPETVKALIAHGAKIETQTRGGGNFNKPDSPLLRALFKKKWDAAKELILAGAATQKAKRVFARDREALSKIEAFEALKRTQKR